MPMQPLPNNECHVSAHVVPAIFYLSLPAGIYTGKFEITVETEVATVEC